MVIGEDGRVGIGTNTPSHQLTISGPTQSTLRLINTTGGTFGETAKINFGDGNFVFITEDIDDHLMIHSDQRTALDAPQVGVGTLTPTTGMRMTVNGSQDVIGSFFAALKFFKIDHPLDPVNKYLVHSCVESSEMKNLYDGVARTDGQGFATITLPDWFEALNEEFRYQLTIIDERGDLPDFVVARVAEKVNHGHFRIRTSIPGVEVSWQVTGVRHDAYAQAHPMAVEQDKPAAARGRYLAPEAYGLPNDRAEHPSIPAATAQKDPVSTEQLQALPGHGDKN